MGSRYYDATTGRFSKLDTERGSISNPLSLNVYGYCVGNPTTYTDQEGDLPTVIVGKACTLE